MDRASSSSSGIPSLVRQLNDSVYELYRPPGMPSMQVLFFHGFQLGDYEGAHLSTWKSGDGSCWPQKWLAEEFPEAHILSVSYNASLTKRRDCANIDLFIIGENIMLDLLQAKIGQEAGCQVILVGHSFGGLVMKEVCLHAQKKGSIGSSEHETFLKSVKGLFFYATPHRGIAASKIAERFVKQGPLLKYVEILSASAARLNDDFENLLKFSNNWRTGGVGEYLPIKWSLLEKSVVVEEASSRYGDDFRVVFDADHISICRPKEKTSTSFNALTRFLGRFSKIARIPGNFQHLPKSIVGVDRVVEEIKDNLRNATSLGLVGMGGIGKTTLAKVLFNDLESHYAYSCFLKDVKNRKEEVVDLVLKNLHFRGKDNSHDGGGLGRLSGEKLLLVLDDVSSEQDLEILSILRDDFVCHIDSRVVVTSRDSELLGVLDAVHTVSFLSPQISKQLLLTYAFPKGILPSFERCVGPVVQKCSGLPLTLEVVGKYLCQKPELIWEQVIQALDKAEKVAGFDEKLWAKLKLSYDSLDKEEQEMFLDAATVFFDQDLDDANAAWSITTSGFQDMRWRHLIDLSLVNEVSRVDWWGLTRISIGMHEQLLSLGRKLARKLGGNSRRIWAHSEQESRVALAEVDDKDNIEEIVGLRLFNEDHLTSEAAYEGGDDDVMEGSTATGTARKRKKSTGENRRIAELLDTAQEGSTATGTARKRKKSTGENRRIASQSYCPGKISIEEAFKAEKKDLITVLYEDTEYNLCDGCQIPIEGDWARYESSFRYDDTLCASCFVKSSNHASEYARIDVTTEGTRVTKFLQRGRLSIRGSKLCKMGKLQYLDLWKTDIYQTHGQTLPSTLVYLSLCHANFSKLPFNPSHHSLMTILVLSRCDELRTLPNNFGQLSSLQMLRIGGRKLESCPDSIGRLPMLNFLGIYRCRTLAKLPETLGELVALESLTLWYCDALSALPESVGRLRRLKFLVIRGSPRLHELPGTFLQLQGLEHIWLNDTSLHSVPDLEKLCSLKTLRVKWERTASFPKLPICLRDVISEQNYHHDLRFEVSDGRFVSAENFS